MPRNCLQRHSFDGRPKNDRYWEVSDCLHFFCVFVCVEQENTVFVDLSRPVLSVPRSPEQRGSIVSLSRASSVPSSLSIESTQTSVLFTQTCLAENCIALAFTERFPHTPLSLSERRGEHAAFNKPEMCSARTISDGAVMARVRLGK